VTSLFLCLLYPEIFVPFRQTLLFDTGTNNSELKQGNRVRFLSQKLLEREREREKERHHVSWRIVMVGNPIVGPEFKPFSFYAQLHVIVSLFPHNKLG
jgi:hypothetical protein